MPSSPTPLGSKEFAFFSYLLSKETPTTDLNTASRFLNELEEGQSLPQNLSLVQIRDGIAQFLEWESVSEVSEPIKQQAIKTREWINLIAQARNEKKLEEVKLRGKWQKYGEDWMQGSPEAILNLIRERVKDIKIVEEVGSLSIEKIEELWVSIRKSRAIDQERALAFIIATTQRIDPDPDHYVVAAKKVEKIMGGPDRVIRNGLSGPKALCDYLDERFEVEGERSPKKATKAAEVNPEEAIEPVSQDYLKSLGDILLEREISFEELPFQFIVVHFEQDESVARDANEAAKNILENSKGNWKVNERESLISLVKGLGISCAHFIDSTKRKLGYAGPTLKIAEKIGFLKPMTEDEIAKNIEALTQKIKEETPQLEELMTVLLKAQLELNNVTGAEERIEVFAATKQGNPSNDFETLLAIRMLAQTLEIKRAGVGAEIRTKRGGENALRAANALNLDSAKELELFAV